MWVRVEGIDAAGRRVSRTWQLRAPVRDGPEVPCMAANLLARSLLAGDAVGPGAGACVSRLPLAAFNAGFARWGMVTSIEEVVAA